MMNANKSAPKQELNLKKDKGDSKKRKKYVLLIPTRKQFGLFLVWNSEFQTKKNPNCCLVGIGKKYFCHFLDSLLPFFRFNS